jgi:hypothetical protein
VRTSSMGRFKCLLFVATCLVLLGIGRNTPASFASTHDAMPAVPAGRMGVPRNSLASNAFAAHSSNTTLTIVSTVPASPGYVVMTGAGSPPGASNITTRKSETPAVGARKTTADSASGPASNGATLPSSSPLILYTDVTSGPNSGGEGNNGTYLTIFGAHFGATRGTSTVTINGRAVAQYILWSDTKIGVQVGHVSSGTIVVSVGGLASNTDKTFTVRSGHIWFIGPGVDNSPPESCATMEAANSYSTPWGLTNYASHTEGDYDMAKMRTPTVYEACLPEGSTLVFLNGVNYPYFDGNGWHASMTVDDPSATPSSFLTFMARPGATAILGGEGWSDVGIRNKAVHTSYTVYSGLTLIGGETDGAGGSGLDAYIDDRVVGNTIECPACSGQAGAMGGATGTVALGNVLTDVSVDAKYLPHGSGKQYHDVYFQGNGFEFGWNRIYNTAAYNGFQINEDGSKGFYNFTIHDNDIADVNGSGINLSDIDPSSGYVRVYNNVIHHAGLNVASDGGEGDPHSCIAVKGYGSATGAGTAEIYNNTMYDCSSYLNINPTTNAACAVLLYPNQLNVTANLVNNVVYQPAYAGTSTKNVYICAGGPKIGTLSGSNNLWYSEGAPRSTAPVTKYGTIANPRFISTKDYHLQNGSPAVGTGIPHGGLTRDFDGAVRASPPAIGAYEYSESDSVTTPSHAGVAAAPNAVAPFLTHKRVVYLSIALVSIILIGVGKSWQATLTGGSS